MRRIHWILLGVLVVAACAVWFFTREQEVQGIVVVVETLPTDGTLPLPLYARSLNEAGEGRRFELLPVPGKANTFHAPGTVAGQYEISNDAGWRMINNAAASIFDPARGPTQVYLGRPYCAYVSARPGGGFELESVVAAERIEGDRRGGFTYRIVEAEIVQHTSGWIGVRLPPKECKPGAQFRISGWLVGQIPFEPIKVSVGPQPRRPYVSAARPASVARLRVVLVGGAGASLDDVEITATPRGLPMEMTDRVRTIGGEATFPGLGAFKDGLLLVVPSWGSGATYTLSVDRWRREGTVFLRALDPKRATWVSLQPSEGTEIENIAVLDAATEHFALAQLDRAADGLRLRTVSGPQTWVVYAGSKVHVMAVDVDGSTAVAVAPTDEAVKVHGKLGIARPGYRVRFRRQLGERWVGGNGMEVDVRVGTRYQAHLPAGRYRIQVVQPGGRVLDPLTLTWEPGTNVELPLDAK